MNSYKQTIEVADVVPNEGNPRKDFGDVEGLAASMATNGGEPFSPIIVVPDGSKYRLVDGERRWRAMVSLGTQRCDALVFPSMGEAETAVAMMATDNSKALDARERLRGFQSMLALGVDDDSVATVIGQDVATVRRVRPYAKDLPEQATLDGLIAAAYDEFSDEERKTIIAEGTRAYGDPDRAAERIRKAHERDAKMGAIRAALPDCIEYRKGAKPWDASRSGLVYLKTVRSESAAEEFGGEWHKNPELVAYEDGIAYALYRKVAEGEVSEKEAAEAAERKARDEHKAAYDEVFKEMVRFACDPWCKDDAAHRHNLASLPAARRPSLCGAIIEGRQDAQFLRFVFSKEAREVLGYVASYAEDEDPSCLEVSRWVMTRHEAHGLMWWTGTDLDEDYCKEFKELYDILCADGYEPSESAQELYKLAEGALEEPDEDDD